MSKRTKGQIIQPKDFSRYMNDLLDEFGAQVVSITEEQTEKVANEAKAKLRLKSTGAFQDRTGSYRRGWRAELRKFATGVTATVFNKTDYRLTHLLEYGHMKQNGKRSPKYPHISKVNDWAIEVFEIRLAQELEERAGQ